MGVGWLVDVVVLVCRLVVECFTEDLAGRLPVVPCGSDPTVYSVFYAKHVRVPHSTDTWTHATDILYEEELKLPFFPTPSDGERKKEL